MCCPTRKHGGLKSPVEILILGEYPWRGSIGADMVQVLHTRKVSCVCTERAEDTCGQAQNVIFSSQACPHVTCARPQYYLAAFREDAVAG